MNVSYLIINAFKRPFLKDVICRKVLSCGFIVLEQNVYKRRFGRGQVLKGIKSNQCFRKLIDPIIVNINWPQFTIDSIVATIEDHTNIRRQTDDPVMPVSGNRLFNDQLFCLSTKKRKEPKLSRVASRVIQAIKLCYNPISPLKHSVGDLGINALKSYAFVLLGNCIALI